MFSADLIRPVIEVGDYVQNIRVPKAFGIVIELDNNTLKATVDWNIPGLDGEETITTTFLTSLRLIRKPTKC